MARKTGNVTNALTLQDNLGGGQIELYFRHPTTEERLGYANASLRREGDKVLDERSRARQEFGLKILTGFKKGGFEDENGKTYASDNADPDYAENWKEQVMAGGADLIELMAAIVFDMPSTVAANKSEALASKN